MSFKNQNKLKAVTFSYDDGATQDIKLIELLNKYGLKGTFNINSELLGKTGIKDLDGFHVSRYIIKKQDVKYVYEGHEVAVHTLTHPILPSLSDEEVIREVEQDRINLSELVGYEVCGMAYPGGGVNNDDRVAEVIKNHTGVKYCRTTVDTDSFDLQDNLYRFNPNVDNVREFDRLMEMGKKFVDLKPDKPQIFYIWGHSYELDYNFEYWNMLEEFCKFISNRDDIYYGTNTEVLL